MRYKKITNVLVWILFANLIVAAVKLSFGYILDINSLTADGFHALTDTFSNIIGIVGIKIASKPADNEHPYGHQKYETIAGLCIGFLLLFIIIRILINSITWFINPIDVEISISSLIALSITIIINIFVATYEYRKGIALKSDVLVSDSIHTKSDIFISSGVLVTMVLIRLGFPSIIDPIISIVIAIFIMKSCYEIFQMTIGILVDSKVVDEERIIKIIQETSSEVKNIHKIRSRGKLDHIFLDMHITTRSDLTVKEAHSISHMIADTLEEKLEMKIDLCCHIEPSEE